MSCFYQKPNLIFLFLVTGYKCHHADRNQHVMGYVRNDLPHRRRSDLEHVALKPIEAMILKYIIRNEQGKSEGFESCDQPVVRKHPIWVKFGDVLYRVTLKCDGWPWKTIGHLSFAVSSFVQHFIAIGEFKLELQSRNAQFGSNSTIFRAVWPWNLMYDLEKQ